jgi:hypothetical protein
MTARPTLAKTLGTTLVAATLVGCHDVTRFTNDGDNYSGGIVQADFVRTGISANTNLCLVLDANHLQDAPGVVSTSDGRFHATPLRTMAQIWHDPLSTFSFGEGRLQNLLYVATPAPSADEFGEVVFVLSLMQSGAVEVRMLRGGAFPDGGGTASELFAIFSLTRTSGPCAY